jgi:hypothetical protein
MSGEASLGEWRHRKPTDLEIICSFFQPVRLPLVRELLLVNYNSDAVGKITYVFYNDEYVLSCI